MEESLKDKALAKMLEEMNKDHTQVEDVIHNWLCGQEDEILFAGVLKAGRTINGAVKYMANLAKKGVAGNIAVVDDATGYGWIRDYFTAEEVEEPKDLNFNVQAAVKEPVVVKKSLPKKKKPVIEDDDGQMSLFEDLL